MTIKKRGVRAGCARGIRIQNSTNEPSKGFFVYDFIIVFIHASKTARSGYSFTHFTTSVPFCTRPCSLLAPSCYLVVQENS